MIVQSPVPNRQAEVGDVYVFTITVNTPSGGEYRPGDFLEILQETEEAPFGLLNSQGNYLCRTKLGDSVWSSIQAMLAGEYLVLPPKVPDYFSSECVVVPPAPRYEREVL